MYAISCVTLFYQARPNHDFLRQHLNTFIQVMDGLAITFVSNAFANVRGSMTTPWTNRPMLDGLSVR